MNFLIQKEDIFNILRKINNITYISDLYNEKNILLSINKNILNIIGNNSEIEINIKYILSKEYESDNILVSYKKLFNICKTIPNNTTINIFDKNNFLFIKTNKSSFSLLLFIKSKLINFDLINKKFDICLSKNNFLSLVKNTCFSMSNKDVRIFLNGMFIKFINNKLQSITTDGHRLSFSEIDINNFLNVDYNIILYRNSILELIKFLEIIDNDNITLIIYQKFIVINSNYYTFTTRLLNEEFPNCDNIIYKKNIYNILINKDIIKETIKRVISILEDKSYLIKLNFNKNKILLSANNINNEFAKEEIEINYLGPKIEIGLNYSYIIDILNNLNSKNIILNFSNNFSSIEINEENNIYKKYIIMPIKI